MEKSRHKVQNGHQSASRVTALDPSANREWDKDPMGTPMQDKASARMTTQPIIVPEFIGENLGVGGGPHANVEASGRGQELHPDPIEAAIKSLMLVRDALRKLAAAA